MQGLKHVFKPEILFGEFTVCFTIRHQLILGCNSNNSYMPKK